MRGKKGEDLIWGGSEKVSRGNRAQVQVVFDNEHRTFDLDFDEVKIERIVHRDGQNEYKLNDSSVRLKDVHELLANANIGSTGHHIISQGEADRVLAAGPRERREMIEDALGLKVYQLKKQETERKLQKTEINIEQVQSLRREAAPHLKYLKRQVEKAERSIEVQKVLREKYTEYLKREDTYLAYHHDKLHQARLEPESLLQEVQKNLDQVKEIIKNTSEAPISDELNQADTAYSNASKARQEAEKELSAIEGQISFIERRLSVVKKTETKVDAFIPRNQLEELVADIDKNVTKVLTKGGEQLLERALSDLVHQLKVFLKHEPGEVIDTSEDDKKELAILIKELDKVSKIVEEAIKKEQEAKEQFTSLQLSQSADNEKNRTAEKDMFALMNERRELESKLSLIDRELTVLNRDREDFKLQLQEAVALLGRAASDYYSYQVKNDKGEILKDDLIVNEDRSEQRKRQLDLEKLKIRLEELGVGSTEELMKEYKNAQERDEFLERELADLQSSVKNLEGLIVEMQNKLHEQFAEGLNQITKEFNNFFMLMFGGGSAALERVVLKSREDDEDEEKEKAKEEGVDLQVSLPNKRVKGLEMLSGGERALTSIALIFAMSQVNPPPFIILDETDAALDEANSRRYGDMIEALAKKSQLVLITHNRETMSRAGVLYGITMGGDGVSKTLSVKFEEAATVAK
jgi:chromosome segregation protein